MKTKIISVGGYLPKQCVSNDELAKRVDTSDTWIVERTGIKFRHIAAEGEYTSDLATEALKDALKKAALTPNDLDGIIVATTTPDLIFPSTACIVQKKLGSQNHSFAFDVSAVCAGFIYALSVANAMIKSGTAKRIAVIGAETMSRVIDWADRTTCVLFGDGAGAVILEATTDSSHIIDTMICADGNLDSILHVPGGISTGNRDKALVMNGREVYKHALEKFASVSISQLERNSLKVSDLSWYIPHQANKRIIDAVATRIGLSSERAAITIDRHANTSAASIPLALNDFVSAGKIEKGQLIQMPALGAGLTWGSALLRW